MKDVPESERREKGIRGRQKQMAGTATMIEGERVTTIQIGERLGIDRKLAAARLSRVRRMDGPVTWARLRGEAA